MKNNKLYIDIVTDDEDSYDSENTHQPDEISDYLELSDIDLDDLEAMLDDAHQNSHINNGNSAPSGIDDEAKSQFRGTIPISRHEREIASSLRLYELVQDLIRSWGWAICGSILWQGNPHTGIWQPIRSDREFDILVRTLIRHSTCQPLINGNSSKELHSWLLSDERLKVDFDYFQNGAEGVIPFSDVVYDVVHDTTAELSLSHRLSYQLNVALEDLPEGKRHPLFDSFIGDITAGAENAACRLQEMFGAALSTGSVRKIFYLESKDTNSTSLLIKLAAKVMDSQYITYSGLKGLDYNFRLPVYLGKHWILSSKEGESIIKNLEDILKLVDGDGICADRKYLDAFDFMPNATIICAGRRLPKLADDTMDSLSDKFIRIKLSGSHLSISRSMEAQLLQCSRDFVSWALEGLTRLASNDWEFTPVDGCGIESDTRAIHQFLEECVEEDSDGKIASRELLEEYWAFCHKNQIRPASSYDVHSVIQDRFEIKPQSIRLGARVLSGYRGIRLEQGNLAALTDGIEFVGSDASPDTQITAGNTLNIKDALNGIPRDMGEEELEKKYQDGKLVIEIREEDEDDGN